MYNKFPLIWKTLIVFFDTLLILTGFYLAFLGDAFFFNTQPVELEKYHTLGLIITISSWNLLTISGLLHINRMELSEVITSVAVTIIQLFIATAAASYLLQESYSQFLLFFASFNQFILLLIFKYVLWRLTRIYLTPQNVLIFGAKNAYKRILARLSCNCFAHYNVHYLETNEGYLPIEALASPIKNADLVILADNINLATKNAIIQYTQKESDKQKKNIQVTLIPETYELFCFNAKMDMLGDIPIFQMKHQGLSLETKLLKRFLDLTVAVSALILISPIFILIAIVILMDSGRPVFYTQVRTGLNEKEFTIFKFRTMRQDAEEMTGTVLASKNDSRITATGRILRATRLDELPQLLNVIIGDMSIVGPRPERPIFVEKFKKEISNYSYRHNVKPGITGFAQVYGKYNTLVQDKLIYDLIYIQKCSVVTDLIVMLKTLKVMLSTGQSKEHKKLSDIRIMHLQGKRLDALN